jgi:heptosyltransferase-2/heptosyltransferase-3
MDVNPFYNLEVPVPEDAVHMSDKYLAIARPLGISVDESRERMYVDSFWDREASKVLSAWGVEGDEPVIAMHPGGARDYTRWSLERFAALGDILSSANGVRVVVVVGKNENWGEKVAELMRSEHIVCRISNIKLLAAVFKRLAAYVGNDTGLLHVASAVGTRSVGIYGSTEPEIWKPKGSHVVSVKAKDDNITSVSVDEVYSAVVDLMR